MAISLWALMYGSITHSNGVRCPQRILGALEASQGPGNFFDLIAVKLFGVGLNDKIVNFIRCALLPCCPGLPACLALVVACTWEAHIACWVSPG